MVDFSKLLKKRRMSEVRFLNVERIGGDGDEGILDPIFMVSIGRIEDGELKIVDVIGPEAEVLLKVKKGFRLREHKDYVEPEIWGLGVHYQIQYLIARWWANKDLGLTHWYPKMMHGGKPYSKFVDPYPMGIFTNPESFSELLGIPVVEDVSAQYADAPDLVSEKMVLHSHWMIKLAYEFYKLMND